MSINWLECFWLQTGIVDVLLLKVYENGTIILISVIVSFLSYNVVLDFSN